MDINVTNVANAVFSCIVICIVYCILLCWYLRSPIMYRFYKPDCIYCKQSEADWNSFSSFCLSARCINVRLDDEKNKYLVENFQVDSVPTIWKVLSNGERYKYDGDRSVSGYKKFISNI